MRIEKCGTVEQQALHALLFLRNAKKFKQSFLLIDFFVSFNKNNKTILFI